MPPSANSQIKVRWPRLAVAAILSMAAILLGLFFGGGFLVRGALKRGIVATLQKRFDADVQIEDLDIAAFPHIVAVLRGVVLRSKDRPEPPLIAIQKLTLSATLLGLLRRHVSGVSLEGLQIRVPPRPEGSNSSLGLGLGLGKKVRFVWVIDEIVSSDALLETLPREAKGVPRDFAIHNVVLSSFSFANSSPFRATLTNPQPFGEIETRGQFGPWHPEQPGDTPVSGTFRYSHADFSSIKGLAGIMSSQGSYSGILDRLDVQGVTEMPDFSLDVADNPMPLSTRYVAVVDGTTGNTYLTSVDARLGNSPIHVSGEIVGVRGARGRKILLEATSLDARAEDLFHLVVKGRAPLGGAVNLRAKIYVPSIPKDAKNVKPVAERISLDGQFDIAQARFSGPIVQNKVDALSRAGQGHPKSTEIKNVPFRLRGKFAVNAGAARLSHVTFDLQGASVQLDGSYGLEGGALDFRGHLLLDAKASQATTGIKSLLLKPFDSLFEKQSRGTVIPFRVTGDRDHPQIRP